jgi:hypothetical protein
VAHSYGLNENEHAAMRALQEAAPMPAVTDPVWMFLVWSGLVFIDSAADPPAVRLTTLGRRYATSAP